MEKIFANFDTTGDKSVDFEEFKVSILCCNDSETKHYYSPLVQTGGYVPSYK